MTRDLPAGKNERDEQEPVDPDPAAEAEQQAQYAEFAAALTDEDVRISRAMRNRRPTEFGPVDMER